MLIDCACGATNRVPGLSKQRVRCGKCQHIFTPKELLSARHEPPPPQGPQDLFLDSEDDEPEDDDDEEEDDE